MKNILFATVFSTITILGIVQAKKDHKIKRQQSIERWKANHPYKPTKKEQMIIEGSKLSKADGG